MTTEGEIGLTARPWGAFYVIEAGTAYQVKRLEIAPGKRISYQTHQFRSEHWHIVQGTGQVTLNGDGFRLGVGQSIDVSAGAAHRIENVGFEVLIFIEVQRGSYLGEDDIVRLEDDYGRLATPTVG